MSEQPARLAAPEEPARHSSERPYRAADVAALRPNVCMEYSQERNFELERSGYIATRHPQRVAAGHSDCVASIVSDGRASTLALEVTADADEFVHASH